MRGKESSGHRYPAAVPLVSLYLGRSRSFNRKTPRFDSSCARCVPHRRLPVVCTAGWLLGWVAANPVSRVGRKEGDLSPAACVRSGLCRRGRAWGRVAQPAAVVFPLPLCKGTAGFSVSGGQGAGPSRELKAQAGRTANALQCLLFSLYFSFMKKWVGQLETTQKTCGASQGICFLGGERGSSALQSAVFVFRARTLPIPMINSCGGKF